MGPWAAAALLAALLAARGAAQWQEDGRSLQDNDTTSTTPGNGTAPENSSTPPADPLVYPDLTMDCTPGDNCSGIGTGTMPESRGICVKGLPSNACWDVCNPDHLPTAYVVSDNASQNHGYVGLVEQVRQGLNSFVQCPSELHEGDPCPPGDVCGVRMAKEFKVDAGKGMCVVDSKQPQSRACWDMCDGSRRPDQFEEGTSATSGAAQTVKQARAGFTCAGGWWPWWAWVLLLLVLGCCAGVLCVASGMVGTVAAKRNRGRATDSRGMDYEQGDDARREQLTHEQPAYDDQYGQSTRDRSGAPRDLAGDYGPSAGDGQPESTRPATYGDVPPPEPSPFPDENVGPGGGARPGTRVVPGLDEPILFPPVQPMVMPTATAQVAPPELLGLTSQLVPPGSPQNVLGSSQRVVPTYGVQNTSVYPQPSSVQMAPGSGGGIPYFTQLAGTGH